MSNHTFNFLLASASLLLLASCGGNTSQTTQATTQDKKTELCTNLARFDTAVATLKSMSPSSTVGDFKKAQEQVRVTFNDVKSTAGSVQNAKTADLERAYEDLDKAIKSIPNTATLKQAANSVAPKVSAVQTAENQMKAGVQCP